MSRSIHLRSFLVSAAAAGVLACGPAEARDEELPDPAPPETTTTALTIGDQRLATGVRLRYAVQGDPAGPAVILLHGYSDSWTSFIPILPLLPERYRVYALDQRGHGGSDAPEVGYHMADMAADVLAFMDAKRIPRAVVVGHSLGSLVAQYVAHASPDRVAGMVLIAGAPSVHHFGGLEDLRETLRALGDSVPQEFIREFQVSTAYRPVPDSIITSAVEASRRLAPWTWRALADGMRASRPVKPAGRAVPTLVMWGDRDAFFLREAQDSLLAMHPAAQLKVYPETGHALHWERPEEVARDLSVFLTGVTGYPAKT